MYCGFMGALVVEQRWSLVARRWGSWSLAGVQVKTSAVWCWWPWMVCRTVLGGCGHASRGHVVSPD